MTTLPETQNMNSYAERKQRFAAAMSTNESVTRTKFILLIAANTLDPVIGGGCKADIASVKEMFEKLSLEMDFNFIELTIAAEEYGKENILEAIRLLTPGSNDIVLFYYTGHGFSYEQDDAKKYPQVDFRPHPSSDNIDVINSNTENLADLFDMIKSRGARLNIVLGDCCNSLIEFKRVFKGADTGRRRRELPVPINKKSCEVLFCDYTASILVASAGKGEYAVSDDQLGSIFTYNFAKRLKKLMTKEIDKDAGLPWEKLLEESRVSTLTLSKTYDIGDGVPGNQTAIYNIDFRKTLY